MILGVGKVSRENSDFEYVEVDGETWKMISDYLSTDDHDSIEEWIVKALTTIIEDYDIMAEEAPLSTEEE